ncbi:MAG: ATPase [Myxococcales bacterium]|nr:ATPase [Myxococcales bacterium]
MQQAFQHIISDLESKFLAKEDAIRMMLVAAVAGEHMVIVGPPGTAKSALVRSFAKHINAVYFEYLLTRFSEPNELFGPIDIQAYRDGSYRRVTEGMLPQAEVVFLDEAFKANSAILNTLLAVMNERSFNNGNQVVQVPLISLYAASNEVPTEAGLDAVFDRFLLRVYSDNLDSYHFNDLLQKGLAFEQKKERPSHDLPPDAMIQARDLHEARTSLLDTVGFSDAFRSAYKGLCFQLRGEGISFSDRRLIRFMKLFAANALIDGRSQVHEGDLVVLKHAWNNMDQRQILADLIDPVVSQFYAEHPDLVPQSSGISLTQLSEELHLVRDILLEGEAVSDIQLFTQLRHLGDIRKALLLQDNEMGKRLLAEADGLLSQVFDR